MPAKRPMYIILNGASETGKSTLIAQGLMYRFKQINEQAFRDSENKREVWTEGEEPFQLSVVQDSFANPMKHFIATTLGVKYAELKKNTMMAVLQGYTPREFLIHLSEHYIKERYGDDAYGRWLEHRILRLTPVPDLVIIDDGRFPAERAVLGSLARVIRVTRPEKTFEGDSRVHLDNPDFVLDNNGTVEQLEPKLDDLVNWIINQLPPDRRPPALVE